MKNIFRLAFASMVLMVSCTEYNELPTPIQESTKFYASIEAPATRTYADENGKLLWNAEDKITIFNGNTYPRQWQFMGEDGKNYGSFEEVNPPTGTITANSLDANYAIYPYAANTTISNDGKILYTIPATQQYAENTFGLGANVMVAVTEDTDDNFLAFKNLCGYFEFSLYGNVAVKSIEFKGNNGEKLAGAATITATNQDAPTFIFANDATKTLTLNCGTGVQLGADAENATKFWFVVPAITYSKGITITITDTEDKVMVKSTSNSITIERSAVQPLSVFEVETRPNNQIWYTNGSTTEATTPYYSDVFGANIISNEYNTDKGCWVITFDAKVTSIGGGAFQLCESLRSVTIPDSVTSIGGCAFSGCESLTSITIPDSVTSIGDYAFDSCSSLTSVTIGNRVTKIGKQAFEYCNSLTSFYGKLASADNRCLIINGVLYGFAPAGLTEYTIPNGVTSIGSWAFSNCSNLASIKISDSVTKIGDNAFYGCSNLTSITIPNSATSIGDAAFMNCSSLKNATVGNGVTKIGGYAFAFCSSLKSITIGNSVTEIGADAFWWCGSLTSITIPDSVTKIGDNAFSHCGGLTSITIPNSVTSIGVGAFQNCSILTSVYCKCSTPPTLKVYAFFANASGRKIYVPSAYINAYKSAENWSNYADAIEGYNFTE